MLLRFRCKNFRSIREEQEISLVATNTRSNERNESLINTPIKGLRVLRCAAIYGANASGKSNMVQAMQVFSRMVSESQRNWKPTGNIPAWDPFALDEFSRADETEFQVDFVIGAVVYSYGFRFNERIILEEWLIDNTRRAKTLFRRGTDGSAISLTFPGRNLGATIEDSRHLDGIKLQTRPNSLFLSSAAQNNHELLSTVFRWIDEHLDMTSRESGGWRYPTAEGCSQPSRKMQLKALLAYADIGITDFEISEEETPEDFKKIERAVFTALNEVNPESAIDISELESRRRHKIVMLHRGANGKPYPLDFGEESSGTRAYFAIIGPLLDKLKNGSGVLIDELESSLHPSLARQIVRIYNDPSLNPMGAQLIFTTHDTNLLDLYLLRRDQVWFTEKNREGATHLSRLSDFRPRKDQNVAAAYIHGRFGAVPYFDEELLRSIVISDSAEIAGGLSEGEAD